MARTANHNHHRRLPPPDPSPISIPTPSRRQPVIIKDPNRPSSRFAEVAGGTAAGCAAVCCCCPCGLVNLLVLAVVRLPAGLFRKALRKQRTKRRLAASASKKAGLLGPRGAAAAGASGSERNAGLRPAVLVSTAATAVEGLPAGPAEADAAEMERRMLAEFYGTGFWRSPSQREEQR